MSWQVQQQGFATALVDPAAAVPAGIGGGASGKAATRRFAVYRNNVMSSLIAAVRDGYPVLTRLVGIDFMNAMAGPFVQAHPPCSPVLLAYGAEFAGFIETFAPASGLPWLADVARLEWAWLEAYHAADALPLAIDALAGRDREALFAVRLGLHPSLRLLSSPHPVASIWAAHQQEATADALACIEPAEQHIIVCRPRLEVDVRVVAPAFHGFVRALAAGASLGEAVIAVADGAAFDPAAAIAHLFRLDLVASIDEAHAAT